jgi:hypothetical protein
MIAASPSLLSMTRDIAASSTCVKLTYVLLGSPGGGCKRTEGTIINVGLPRLLLFI